MRNPVFPARFITLLLTLLSPAFATRRDFRHFKSKPREEVDLAASWADYESDESEKYDQERDIVRNSLLLEGKHEAAIERKERLSKGLTDLPASGNASLRHLLQSTSCPGNAVSQCSALSEMQVSQIRAGLIGACSIFVPSQKTNGPGSCCSTLKGSSSNDYNNNLACLCGDTGGIMTFIPRQQVNSILQSCASSTPSGNAGFTGTSVPPPLSLNVPSPTPISTLTPISTTGSSVSSSSASASATSNSGPSSP